MSEPLSRIESYYDAVPRSAARTEALGPFTLFINTGPGWPYYARPSLGTSVFSVDEVEQACTRQKLLGVPQAFEWVKETTPALFGAVNAAGLKVEEHPLLVLDSARFLDVQPPSDIDTLYVSPQDDVALISSVAGVGFRAAGTAVGPEGALELRAAAARRGENGVEFERQRLRAGTTVMAAAFLNGLPVSVGSHNPVGGVSEIVGVATLPAYRRRGIAAAVVRLLIKDALGRGADLIFLTADDAAVARVYARLGFREIATACVAEKT